MDSLTCEDAEVTDGPEGEEEDQHVDDRVGHIGLPPQPTEDRRESSPRGDDQTEQEETEGREALEAARVRGRRANLKVRTTLIRTRNPGAAIVEEAERRGSEVIFLSTIHAPASEHALGPVASYLLERRPCRIVVETEPASNGGAAVAAQRG